MVTHQSLWQALDELANEHGLSASALARRAGLDPTLFNKSKRFTTDGRPRWPSTESLAKVLSALDLSITDFAAFLNDGKKRMSRRIPVIGYAQAGQAGYFDDAGYPSGAGWDEIVFPDCDDPHVYALEITGDSMEPCYREGDLIIVSPSAQIRRGDRVAVKTRKGEVMAKLLNRITADSIQLSSFNTVYPPLTLDRKDLEWMSRILWVSQ